MLLFVYSKDALDKAEDLFKEMLKKDIRPTYVTFSTLIAVLSQVSKPQTTRDYLNSMEKEYGLAPKHFHYGALIDAHVRTRTSNNISEAVQIVKEVPIAVNEMTLNSILSLVTLPQYLPKKTL